MAESTPSTLLILGGMKTYARSVVSYVVASQGNGRWQGSEEERGRMRGIKFIRIVDKYSISPATTYLDAPFRRAIEIYGQQPSESEERLWIEYRQANLGVKAKVEEAFVLPERYRTGGREQFDVVVDLLGETVYDRPEVVHIDQSFTVSLAIATHASTLSPPNLAYIKVTPPYYEMKSSSPSSGYRESSSGRPRSGSGTFGSKSDDKAVMRPDGVRGRWWHECVRAMGRLSGLNLVVLRTGEVYGPGVVEGSVLARLVIGHVYKHLGEEMKFLHKPDLRIHTLHATDLVRAIFQASAWMRSVGGRQRADEVAGEVIGSSWETVSSAPKTAGVVPPGEAVKMPLFHLVDENDSNQDKLAKAVAQHFGIKYGFHGAIASLVSQFSMLDFSEAIEDVNEHHLEAWHAMMTASAPLIEDTPISPYLEPHAFSKRAINLDGSKFRKVTGFTLLKPKVQVEELAAIVKGFQGEGLWPRV